MFNGSWIVTQISELCLRRGCRRKEMRWIKERFAEREERISSPIVQSAICCLNEFALGSVLMHQQMPQHLLLCLVVDAAAGKVGNARLISYKELSWCRLLPLMKVSPSLNSCCLLDIPAAICSASLQPVWGVRADASAFCWCNCLSVFTQQNGWRMVGSHLSVAELTWYRMFKNNDVFPHWYDLVSHLLPAGGSKEHLLMLAVETSVRIKTGNMRQIWYTSLCFMLLSISHKDFW